MITVSWLIATLIFFYFSLIFWRFGNEPIRTFTIRQRSEKEEDQAGESEDEELTSEFLGEFGGYLKSVNDLNKFRYRLAAGGFLVAALTALLLALALI
ncbi:MAG: hypothetical protein E3J30_11775 [Anaerolineales bacterium]|nr:MAG: hypothetical protein E3J30_11775 [Anaerolineales bacterium]